MLTGYANKMLRGAHAKAPALTADTLRGRCPVCNAVAPLVVSHAWGRPRPVVLTCRCLTPPVPAPITENARA